MKRSKTISMLICLIVAFFISASIKGQPQKLLVVYTKWFPYTYEENGNALGFEIEIIKEVFGVMNIPVEFQFYPWNRCLFSLKNGEADALVSLLKTPERETYTYFPDVFISISKTVLFTTADKNITFNGSYEELKDYSFGVISGFSYGDVFDNATYLKKDAVSNHELLINKILHGRNDLGAENQAVISAYAHKMNVQDKIRFLEPPIHTQKLYVGFSRAKGLKNLSESFSRSLGKYKASSAYVKILKKYGVKYTDMIEQ